jgi:hypothetical protein
VFTVVRDSVQTPNTARIKVYNLSQSTIARIQKEFTRIFLQVGYQGGQLSTIFNGYVIRMTRGSSVSQPISQAAFLSGRENQTDTFLEFIGTDGDKPYNFATMSVALAAGSTVNQQLQTIAQALAPFNMNMGYTNLGGKGNVTLPRGIVLHGMVRDVLDDFCRHTDTTWSIQDGKVEIVAKNQGSIPGAVVVVSPKTGLIGLPRETLQGVEFTTLMNPYLRVGRAVQIQAQIQQTQPGIPISGQLGLDPIVNPLNPNGFYRIFYFQHVGDTRGNPWYTNCVARVINSDGSTAGPNPGASGSLSYY